MDDPLKAFGIASLEKRVLSILQSTEPLTVGQKHEIGTYCSMMKFMCMMTLENQTESKRSEGPPMSMILEIAADVLQTARQQKESEETEERDDAPEADSPSEQAAAPTGNADEPEQLRQ